MTSIQGLSLTLRGVPPFPVDASALSPDRLCSLPDELLLGVRLNVGARSVSINELFLVGRFDTTPIDALSDAAPAPAEPRLHLSGPAEGLARLDKVGRGMKTGMLVVHGPVGDAVGLDMAGGQIEVQGDCGAYAASGLRKGTITIAGNAGDHLGGVQPGNSFGMRGGVVVVRGNAGDRCGDRMRRGMILVEGDAGDWCGYRLVAGTIIVGGRVGARPGFNLLHGSIITRTMPRSLLGTFGDSGKHDFPFLALLARSVDRHSPSLGASLGRTRRAHRLAGDLAAGGRGEILVLQ